MISLLSLLRVKRLSDLESRRCQKMLEFDGYTSVF